MKDQTSRRALREHGELFTVREVAARLKVKNLPTIYDWIKKGDARGKKLGAFKVGDEYRVSEKQIEEFLA